MQEPSTPSDVNPLQHPTALYPAADASPPAEPKKSKTLLWLLLGGVVLLLAVIGGGVGYVLSSNDDAKDKDVVAAPSAVASSAAPSPSATVSTPPALKITLTTPAKLGNRPLNKDPKLNKDFAGFKDTLPGSGDSVVAIYGDVSKKNMTIVIAAGAAGMDPEIGLAAVLDGLKTSGMTVTGTVTVPAGPLGGVAKCGSLKVSGVPTALCSWADEGSIGIIWFFQKTPAQVKGEFATLRAQIEKKA